VKYVLALAVALVLNAVANLLMKVGMKTVQSAGGILKDGPWAALTTVLSSGTLVIGLACFGLNALFYMYALQSSALKISVAYPVMVGGGYALIAVVAHLHPALSESLTSLQKLGVGMVLAGILLIAAQAKTSAV